MIAAGVHESLFTVVLNNLQVGIYIHLDDDTSHRLSGLIANVELKLDMERAAQGGIDLVITAINVGEIFQSYNEIAPSANLSAFFELALDLGLSLALSDGLRFNVDLAESLQSAMGVSLGVNINRVRRDFGSEGHGFISAYATLCGENDFDDINNASCYRSAGAPSGRSLHFANTTLTLAPQELYASIDDSPHSWPLPKGSLVLTATQLQQAENLSYQYRVDAGPWTSFRSIGEAGELVIQSPRLWVMAYHTIDVRIAVKGTRQQSSVLSYSLWLDAEPPQLQLKENAENQLVAQATDLGSSDRTEIWFQRDLNDWERYTEPLDMRIAEGPINFRARDLAGNSSEMRTWTPSAITPTRSLSEETPAAQGCTALAPQGWALLGLCVALLGRRRKRQF